MRQDHTFCTTASVVWVLLDNTVFVRKKYKRDYDTGVVEMVLQPVPGETLMALGIGKELERDGHVTLRPEYIDPDGYSEIELEIHISGSGYYIPASWDAPAEGDIEVRVDDVRLWDHQKDEMVTTAFVADDVANAECLRDQLEEAGWEQD